MFHFVFRRRLCIAVSLSKHNRRRKNIDYLAPVIAQTVKEEIGSTERNIARMLFKLAVESAMVSELQAAQLQVSQEQMADLRQMCSRIVAENNGIITFEKAYATQHRNA